MSELTLDTLVKATAADAYSTHGGTGRWVLGRWRSVKPPLVPCRHGLHVVTIAQLPAWLGPRIGVVEVAGERIDQDDKVVVERARVTDWLDTWDESSARLFAADCAERALPSFVRVRPDEDRPYLAIAAARQFARGEISEGEAVAARDAARAAARDAASDAERQWQADRLLAYLRGEA